MCIRDRYMYFRDDEHMGTLFVHNEYGCSFWSAETYLRTLWHGRWVIFNEGMKVWFDFNGNKTKATKKWFWIYDVRQPKVHGIDYQGRSVVLLLANNWGIDGKLATFSGGSDVPTDDYGYALPCYRPDDGF